MGLCIKHIIALLQIKGVGRKTVFSIADTVEGINFSDRDFSLFLSSFLKTNTLKRVELTAFNNIEDALIKAQMIIENSLKEQINILSFYDDEYPTILKKISNPPIAINYKGNLNILKQKKGIAIIGTREPTKNGEIAADFFGKEFSKLGFNIVSGLAIGCDTYAHKGCISVNGQTTAILGNGLDDKSIYPKENLELTKQILKNGGLLLSEYFIGTRVSPSFLIDRDRLQSGISQATIVIQTGIEGGTMHAVNSTLVSNKPLACVQYNISENLDNVKTKGNIKLIDEGAFPLSSRNISDFENIINNKFLNSSNDKIKGIIFDLDQTLVDSNIAEKERQNRNWNEVYTMIPFFRLYDGYKEVFKYIKSSGLKVCIVTNSPKPYAEKVLSQFQIPYDYIVAFHDVKKRKPDSEPMLKALSLLNENANNVISFGDRVDDIVSSNKAKIKSIACAWGTNEKGELDKSSFFKMIKKATDIIDILNTNI